MAPLPPPAVGALVDGAPPEPGPEPSDGLARSGAGLHPVENAINAEEPSHARARRQEQALHRVGMGVRGAVIVIPLVGVSRSLWIKWQRRVTPGGSIPKRPHMRPLELRPLEPIVRRVFIRGAPRA